MNHMIPAKAMTASSPTPIPMPAFAPVLVPESVDDGEGERLPVAELAKLVAVELEEVAVALEIEEVELD